MNKGGTPENLKPFKEGESGNPNGRPKGVRNLSTILREMLEEDIEITTEDGKKERKQLQDVLVRKLIKKATGGEIRAIQEIFDRVEGKPLQKNQTEITTKEPIIIDWTTTDPEAKGSAQDSDR